MTDQPFEHAVRDWLDDGSDRTPPAAIDAVLLAVKTTPQERDLRIPRRFIQMPTYMRLAAAIALVAVVGVGALTYFNNGPGPGGPPTPRPTASALPTPSPLATLAPLDTAGWVPFVSERYGFTVDHPDDWSLDFSDHDWTFENDIEAWQSSGVDSFINGVGDVRFSAWAARVAPGSTLESLMETYCVGQNGGPCTGLQDRAVDIETGDGVPGRGLYGAGQDTMAFFLEDDTMYVVAVWRDEVDASVQPYGGAWRLLKAFASTLTLPAESPLGSPSAS